MRKVIEREANVVGIVINAYKWDSSLLPLTLLKAL